MSLGRPPKQPPCAGCGIPPVCYKAPYYRCHCGKFILEAGTLRPVKEQKPRVNPPCPVCGCQLSSKGRPDYFRCLKGCRASFNRVEGELVKVVIANPRGGGFMTRMEYEESMGWEEAE